MPGVSLQARSSDACDAILLKQPVAHEKLDIEVT